MADMRFKLRHNYSIWDETEDLVWFLADRLISVPYDKFQIMAGLCGNSQ
ncbi:hypothetical protein HNR49_002534 [Halobacterium salinarum]|uniref:Uncharacterized protein n=1 Tax=Halobacterium salinarum TaxID=2242 RepID=A0A841HEM8_HALSI|nr:hypothetical protein [Halobacterium salinarum]